MYNVNTEVHSCNHCCSEKKKYYIFWVCVGSLSYPTFNAHAPAQLYNIFPHYYYKRYDSRKCVL